MQQTHSIHTDHNRLHTLNTQINTRLAGKRNENWNAFWETQDHGTNPPKLHRIICSITNSNSGITQSRFYNHYNQNSYTKQQANILILHYCNPKYSNTILLQNQKCPQIPWRQTHFQRKTRISISLNSKTSHNRGHCRNNKTTWNSSAVGIDSISNIHLAYTHSLTHSLQTTHVHTAWNQIFGKYA